MEWTYKGTEKWQGWRRLPHIFCLTTKMKMCILRNRCKVVFWFPFNTSLVSLLLPNHPYITSTTKATTAARQRKATMTSKTKGSKTKVSKTAGSMTSKTKTSMMTSKTKGSMTSKTKANMISKTKVDTTSKSRKGKHNETEHKEMSK